ncbi:hypothetical protein GCM10011316_34010 [Roseibium aquae]|uniref:Lectin-like protein BA14k n=1 Tax=Roseibium aquae TaxID=1323746 RepID=A0A916X240_9HYPH|nr:BA14K family protein [Roseibium aquae]GGB59173.1 hypothetical protein GCM10011316_34010 [Roseibium aquae]
MPHRALLTSSSAILSVLAVLGTAWAADPIQAPPPQAAPAPPRVIYVEPVRPQAYLPPAYDAPGPRWRNGYRGSGWKIYNGWWYPPENFSFNTVPPRVAPAPPYNPHGLLQPQKQQFVAVPQHGIAHAPPPEPAAGAAQPAFRTTPRPGYGHRTQARPVPSPRTSGQPQHSDAQRVQHVNWCLEAYPDSYLVSNNTYQPRGGPRAQCRSPYSSLR